LKFALPFANLAKECVFDYHKREEVAKIGPVTATVDKAQRTTVPPVVAAALLIAGAVLLVLGSRIK
jgi:hypothetical protein